MYQSGGQWSLTWPGHLVISLKSISNKERDRTVRTHRTAWIKNDTHFSIFDFVPLTPNLAQVCVMCISEGFAHLGQILHNLTLISGLFLHP